MTEQDYKPSKALMSAVIGMGFLIVVGVAGLVGVILHRMNAPTPHTLPSVPLTDTPTPPASTLPVQLNLQPGEHVAGLAGVGAGQLALHIAGQTGDRVVLWDATSGQFHTAITIPPAAAPR